MKVILILIVLVLLAVFVSLIHRFLAKLLEKIIRAIGFLLVLPFLFAFGVLVLLFDGLRLLLTWLAHPLRQKRRQARRAWLENFVLPRLCVERFRFWFPTLNEADCAEVEQDLRRFFMAVQEAGRKPLAMPSVVAGQLWQEWSLLPQYHDFCQQTFGRHLPYQTPQWQATGRVNRAVQHTWHALCRQEQINPNAPNRLPSLFALDGKFHIQGGLHYTLTAQEACHLQRQASAPGTRTGKAQALLTALMILPVGALAMSTAPVPESLIAQYFAWLEHMLTNHNRPQQQGESLSENIAGELAEGITESTLDAMLNSGSDIASNAASGLDLSGMIGDFLSGLFSGISF